MLYCSRGRYALPRFPTYEKDWPAIGVTIDDMRDFVRPRFLTDLVGPGPFREKFSKEWFGNRGQTSRLGSEDHQDFGIMSGALGIDYKQLSNEDRAFVGAGWPSAAIEYYGAKYQKPGTFEFFLQRCVYFMSLLFVFLVCRKGLLLSF